HLDSLLFHTDSGQLADLHQELKSRIPDLFDYQIGYCMRIGKVRDTAFVNSILTYRQDSMIQRLETEIEAKFADLSPQRKELIDALIHLKAQVPSAVLPQAIVFQNSLFTSSAFSTDK